MTGHESAEEEYRYSSGLSLTSAIVQESGWDAGPVWMDVENLAPTGIQLPVCPAHSKSLHQLHYPSPYIPYIKQKKFTMSVSSDFLESAVIFCHLT